MRIVIDLQSAQNGSRHRGIGRYSLSLIKALLRNRGHHEIVVLLSGLFPDTIVPVRSILVDEYPGITIRVWDGIGPTAFLDRGNDWRRLSSQLIREAFIASLEPDVLLVSSMFEGAGDDTVASIGQFGQILTAVILYDLIPLIYRKDYLADKRVMDWYLEKMDHLKKADILLAISESSRRDGILYLGLPDARITNISAAADPEFHKHQYNRDEIGRLYSKFGIKRPFLMYSGATDPRKNIYKLIEAYASVPTSLRYSHQLVLAGGMPEGHRAALLRHAKLVGLAREEMVVTGRISDDELIAFYSLCKAFILPSLYEGFGLPALEAMACGAPTIGSNVSSIPEVIGLDAALFDPLSVEQISKKIVDVLSNDTFRALLIENARTRSALFSWDSTARLALRELELLFDEDPPYQGGRSLFDGSRALSTLISKTKELESSRVSDSDLLACASAMASILPRDEPTPKIFVDVSEFYRRDSQTGIQRVVRSITRMLLESSIDSQKIEFVYATEKEPYRCAVNFSRVLLDRELSANLVEDKIIDPRDGDIFLGLDYHDQIVCSHARYYDYLRQRGIYVCFVVYDLLPVTLTDCFSDEVKLNYEKWLRVVTAQDAITCISRTVADELNAWLSWHGVERLCPLQVNWFHLGADMYNSVPTRGLPDSTSHVLEELAHRPTFLMVGTLEPRKGYIQTLASFDLLWKLGVNVNLVIVGKQGWMVENLIKAFRSHFELNRRLFWLENISDEYLEKIYAASACLIAASEGEGFGLPLIEAAQQKLPIIARDIPVFKEVAGGQAFYFDGKAPEDLARAIREWLLLFEAGQHPTSDNIPWLTWRESTSRLMQIVLAGAHKEQPQGEEHKRRDLGVFKIKTDHSDPVS